MQNMTNSKAISKESLLPRDFFSFISLVFIAGSAILFGEGQLKFIGVLLAGSYTLYFLKQKKGLPTEFVIYFIWLVWSFSGYIVSIDKEAFLETFILASQIFIMSFAISGIAAYRATLNINFFALVIGSIILIFLSLTAGVQITADPSEKVRMQGITTNPNIFGYILLISTSALLYFWGKVSWKARSIIILLIGLFTFFLILSGSRKAFIGLVILILLWFWMCYKKELLKKPSLFISLIIIVIGLFYIANYAILNTYMGTRFRADLVENPIYERQDDYDRIVYYRKGFEILKNSPIFGIGLGNFAVVDWSGHESHSDYVEIAACTGIVGFLLYFSIYVLLWRRLGRIERCMRNCSILYNVGILKASILIILLLGFGRPNFKSQITWIFLSTAIGYAWSMEKKIDYLKKLYSKNITYSSKNLH